MDDNALSDAAPPAGTLGVPPEPWPPVARDRHAPPVAVIDRPLPTWALVLTLALPVLMQNWLILTVNLSDRLLAGRFQDVGATEQLASQAAQTTAGYLAWFITCYTVLVSVGSTALVARFVGAGDHRAAVHVTNQSILLAVLLGLLGSAAGLAGVTSLMTLLRLHGPAAELAAAYLRPLFLLLVFQMIETAGVACLVGAGDTRTGFKVLGSVALINIPLAWGFFQGVGPVPGLGFVGIALGTAVSHTLGGIAVLVILARGRAGLRLHTRQLWPRWDLLYRLLRVSVPAGADSLSVGVGQLWFLGIVNQLGDTAGGAHGIALNWEALGYQSGAAFGTAAMTLVGQNLGAGRPAAASRCGWTAFAMGGVMMTLMGGVFYTLAPWMFRLFCPKPEQQPIVEAGVPVLRLVAFAMPALACSIILTNALRGAGDTRLPVLFSLIGFFAIRIPLASLLTGERLELGVLGTWPGLDPPLLGAWVAMFADILVRGLFFLGRFAGGRWKEMRV